MSLVDQQWCPTSVQVTVLQARGLRIKGKSGTNDAYAVMQMGKEKYQTSVVEKSVAPVWKEEAAFDLPPLPHQGGGGGGSERGTLHVHVMHRALVGPDKLLGQAVINLLQLSDDETRNKTEWFKLLDKTGKADKDRGEVFLDIQFMRNNMTASMFDLSAAGKSRSRLGKFKDKVRGKKKESDAVSSVVPSFTQVLTDSEEEAHVDGEVATGKDEKKKKHKMKSLFSPKSNLQKNMSQSLSVLPGGNASLSGNQSSGLNVESSEGKKKFKFMMHKRSGSSDSKNSSSGHQKHGTAEQSNLCINGSHVYCEEPQTRTSRIGSNFSLASSGHGSMEDVPESCPPVADSLRAVRQYSPWMEEEEMAEVENISEDVDEEEEEEERLRMEEECRKKEENEEKVRRQEDERKRIEERVKREEDERIQRAEERKKQQEEEERVRKEKQEKGEREKLAELKRTLEEQERKRIEEEKRHREEVEWIRRETERAEEERGRQEEEEKLRREQERKLAEEKERRIAEEKIRQEEEERRRTEQERAEEERRRLEEEQEMKRRLEDQQRQREEEERIKKEEERRQKEKEEYERLVEEKRKLEEERKRIEAEEKIREEERIRKEEEVRREEEREQQRRAEEEEKRQREKEERIKEEERRRAAEERARKEKEEYERLLEDKRRQEEQERKQEEELIRKREQERIRMEEERRRHQEEERARKEREEHERLVEEKKRQEEEERRQEEELIRKREQERIRMEEERRRHEEEERTRKEREEHERLVEEKKRQEEEERRQKEEKELIRKREQERIRMEEERKRHEEERMRKEKEEMKRLAEEKKRLEGQEKMRIEEEQNIRWAEVEKAERERKDGVRKLEEEKLTRDAEKWKERENESKAGHTAERRCNVAVESPADVTSTNPFDDSYNPFEKDPGSSAGPDSSAASASNVQLRCQSAVSLGEIKTISSDEKDLICAQREKRPAPQPPGRNQAESDWETDVSTRHLAQITKQSDNRDIKTANVLPQRSVQMIAPVSRSPTETNSTQSFMQGSTTKGTTGVPKQGKRPAPHTPRSVEEEPSSESKTSLSSVHKISGGGSEAKPVQVVYGLNPFEDDVDENETQSETTTSSNTGSICWSPAVSQTASHTKIKSSKVARAPLPPDCVTIPDDSPTQACVPESEAIVSVQERPPQESQPVAVQNMMEEAGVKQDVHPTTSRRLQPVKPLNPLKQQPVSIIKGEKDNKSTGILGEVQDKTKVKEARLKGPYSQLTQEELISLVLKQEKQLTERDKTIADLEQYIDNLLVRVIEEKPSILMSISSMKKAV